MKMDLKKIAFWAAGLSFAYFGCDQKPLPPPVEKYQNLVSIRVLPVFARLDSQNAWIFSDTLPAAGTVLWQKNIAYKISFEKDMATWDPALANEIILYRIYRNPHGSENRILVQNSFGPQSGHPIGTTIIFQSLAGTIDTIVFDGLDYIYDVVNNSNLEQFAYSAAAVTGIRAGPQAARFSGGFEHAHTLSPYFGGGLPTYFTINGGAYSTRSNIVEFAGRIDTTGLKKLVVVRYAEIAPLSSNKGVFAIADSAGYSGANQRFLFGVDTLTLRSDSTVIKTLKGFKYTYGKLGRTDTIDAAPESLQTYFQGHVAGEGGSYIRFSRKDTLVDGVGKKWIGIRGLWDSTFLGQSWEYFIDDIQIDYYYATILLDRPNAKVVMKDFEDDKKICLLDDDIPFEFNTFGDPYFSDEVYVWIATHAYSSEFFNLLYNSELTIASLEKNAQGLNNKPDSEATFWDCLLETPPQKFTLDENGRVRGRLDVDYEKDYRVSPLKDLGKLNRLNRDQQVLSRGVSIGSVLGYDESNLNLFVGDTAKRDTVLNFPLSGGMVSDQKSISRGWHVVPATPDVYNAYAKPYENQKESFKSMFPEYYTPYDANTLHLCPFRSLPLNVYDIKKGDKEFLIIAYTKGKFFNEPRVFISANFTIYKYVWDKVPPQIVWAADFDPLVNAWYAPMAYRDPVNSANDRVTNLMLLQNVFNVFLSAIPPGEAEPSVRDVGFGKIKSVTLCFHHSGGGYTVADPSNGLRAYDTPVKRFPLDRETLERQEYFPHGLGNVANHIAYSIANVGFRDIDASRWERGTYDMWIETEDNLGNRGMAPCGSEKWEINLGKYFVRQVEIK